MNTPGAEMVRRLNGPWMDPRRAVRRPVRLRSLDELVADAERIGEAARACAEGRAAGSSFRVTGNWSAGQVLEHVARTVERSLDGFRGAPSWEAPPARGLERITGMPGRSRRAEEVAWARAKLLALEQDPGGPSIGGPGELAPPAMVWTEDALGVLRHAVGRVRAGERMERPSPTIGPLSHEEWLGFHLRHAELHFSFVVL
jgi:hypothetical protein